MKGKHFHCPVNGWDCPYYKDNAIIEGVEEYCLCTMDDPYHDCDDFFCIWEGDSPEDYTDYVDED